MSTNKPRYTFTAKPKAGGERVKFGAAWEQGELPGVLNLKLDTEALAQLLQNADDYWFNGKDWAAETEEY